MFAAVQQHGVTMPPRPPPVSSSLRATPAAAESGARVGPACNIDIHHLSPALTSRPIPVVREVLIRGLTQAGREFRPSDWSERLAGALSSFRPKGSGGIGAHIGYSPYCIPRVIDGVKCVIVNEALRDLEPMAWDFAMNFARDNELQVAQAGTEPKPPAL